MLLSFIHHFIILYKGEKTPVQNMYINKVIEIANSPENWNILLAKTSPFRVGQRLTVSTGGFQLTSASPFLAKLCWPWTSNQSFCAVSNNFGSRVWRIHIVMNRPCWHRRNVSFYRWYSSLNCFSIQWHSSITRRQLCTWTWSITTRKW